jgi:signal transduction histidine kinase
MIFGRANEVRSAWTPHLWWAFFLIISGFVITGCVSLYVMQHTQHEIESIEGRAITGIQLVFQLSHDIEVKRRLFEAHIVENSPAGMAKVEQQIADADDKIARAAHDYEPTIFDEYERGLWEELQAEISAVTPQSNRILELSRQNKDEEARTLMKALDPGFDSVSQTMDALVRLNRTRAAEEVGRARDLHRIATIVLLVLTIGLTAFALIVARWVTQLIRQHENRMRAAMAQLEDQNRELDAFAGRVAHDLRGPLTAINLAAFSLERLSESGASGVFRRAVRQMEAIIQDLLTLSRISAQSNRGSCETTAATSSAEEDLRPKVEELNGTLYIEAATATVQCSEGLLRQVLWNLGENAVKYRRTDVRLKVEIRGRIVAHAYEFTVCDNGSGMSHSEAQHVFEPFFRGEHVRQSTPGTGLGLSIVKRVIEASGGSVSVDSVAGRGTTFKVRLPLSARRAA